MLSGLECCTAVKGGALRLLWLYLLAALGQRWPVRTTYHSYGREQRLASCKSAFGSVGACSLWRLFPRTIQQSSWQRLYCAASFLVLRCRRCCLASKLQCYWRSYQCAALHRDPTLSQDGRTESLGGSKKLSAVAGNVQELRLML